jgi:hypothetical protein
VKMITHLYLQDRPETEGRRSGTEWPTLQENYNIININLDMISCAPTGTLTN